MQGGRIISIALTIVVALTHKVYMRNRVFTFGIIDSDPEVCHMVNYTAINTSGLNRPSLILKHFSISEKTNLVFKASLLHQQNIIALIEGSHTKTSACALSTVTDIPLIRLHGDSRPFDQCEKAVHMSGGYIDYAHASLDILNTFGWKTIALAYDESRSHEAGYFHAISRSSKLTVYFIPLYGRQKHEYTLSTLLRAMDEIRSLKPEVVVLFTSKENTDVMLQQKPGQHKWILQGQVPLNLRCHPHNVVLAVTLPHNEKVAPLGLEKLVRTGNDNDTRKEHAALAYDAVQVIIQALKREPCSLMNGTAITSQDRDAMLTCIRKVNFSGLTGPIQFNEDGKRIEMELEIFNLRNNSFTKVGTWNSSRGAALFENILRNVDSSPTRRRSLEGRKFRVVVVEDAPFVMMEKKDDGTIAYQGYCIDLLNELARNLHFTFDIYPSPDGMYGAETDNGTWNGMIGELISERADLVVAELTITKSREEVVDFSVPYMYYTEDMLLKKTSSKETIHLLQFMNPFHSHVWFAKLATLVIISVAVFAINYLSPFGYKSDDGRGTSEKFNLSNSVWFALGCMLQQGAENQPRSLSGRILTGCYWFCILIWISTYTANLAAFFTVKNAHQPISNLEDLAKSSFQVVVLNASSTYEAFKTSQYETHREIWHRIQQAGAIVSTTSHAIRWVRENDDMVFINDGPILRHAANKPPCDLTTVPGLTTAKALGLALQADDPHTRNFTLAILHLHENFFLANLKRKWWAASQGCPKEHDTILSRKRIDLTSMLGVYVVLGVGMIIAFLTLTAEILWKRKAKRKGKASFCTSA